ncbi:hypothetical protein B0J14DRAFT_621326 [Halenospora varia]|nr:hypothetical protein B0J14DRAFT_621326 [Halenospora varia]
MTVFGVALLSWLGLTFMRYRARRTTAHPSKNGNNIDPNNGAHGTTIGATPLYGERIFHYLWALAAFIGFITYFTMASDLGNTPVRHGVNWATIFFAIALQEIWVVSWLSGALVTSSYKWGYFTCGFFAYFLLAYILLGWGLEHARRIQTGKDYTLLAGALVLLWVAFPVAWGLSEGSNKLSITGEMIFYGILDLILVPLPWHLAGAVSSTSHLQTIYVA